MSQSPENARLNLSEQQQIVHAADKWRFSIHDEHIGDLFIAVERVASARLVAALRLAADELAATTEGQVAKDAARGNTASLSYVNCTRIDADFLRQRATRIEKEARDV